MPGPAVGLRAGPRNGGESMSAPVSDERWSVDRFTKARDQEVLSQARTDLGSLEDSLERHRSLPEANRADLVFRTARERAATVVQPRHGETLIDGQIRAMQALDDAGADVLSVLTDAYTRQLKFEDAERGLRESEEAGRSLISGYPIVARGAKASEIIVDSVNRPCSVRMASSDARLCKELYMAAGFTYMFMGPVQNLAYEKLATPEELIHNYQYEDRLIGYFEDSGCPIVKELPATLTGTLVPPCIALTSTLIDTMLAVKQGVRRVVCSYGLLGNLIQDVAAIRVLRELANEYVAEIADDVEIYIDTPQWMGDFPHEEAEAYGVVLSGSIAAVLGGADEIITKSLDEAFGVPTLEANVAGVVATKQVAELLGHQPLPASAELDAEMDLIRRSVRAILDATMKLGEGDLAAGTAAAIRTGVIDVPFSPNVYNAGVGLTARDMQGRVRWLNPGSVPLPADVRAFHEERIAERAEHAGKAGYQLTVDDVVGFSKGLSPKQAQPAPAWREPGAVA